MSDVFISYSRRDKEFAQKLQQALKDAGQSAWIDWIDIPPTADWWKEIQRGIEGADTFVCIISPDSVSSSVCADEVNHAVRHNKRMVPVVCRDGFADADVHEELRKPNWIPFREQDDFEKQFGVLMGAIATDLEHVRAHTRLLVRTLEWENKGRNDSFLLRGEDLLEAETWLNQATDKEPQPTEQQKNYIIKSREAEDAQQRILEEGKKSKRRLRLATIAMGVSFVTLGGIGYFSYRQLNEARAMTRLEQQSISNLGQFRQRQLDTLVVAMESAQELKALVGDKPLSQYPTVNPLSTLRTILDGIQEQNQFKGHQGRVITSFSPDGKQIATAGQGGTLRLWGLDGKLISEFKAHEVGVNSVSFSPDGKQIATAGQDGTVRFWSLDGKPISFKVAQDVVNNVSFSPDGKQIATAGVDGTIQLWSLNGKLISKFKGAQTWVNNVSFSPDGKQIAVTGIEDDTMRLWSLDGKLISEFKAHQGGVTSFSFSPDGKQIATAGFDGTRFWSLDGKPISFKGVQDGGTYISFSPDGKQIAIAGLDGTARLLSLDGKQISEFKGGLDGINSVTFSPNGKQIVIAGLNGTARLLRLDSKQISEFKGDQDSVWSVSFSPNGRQLATAGSDGTARLWSLDGKKISEFNGGLGRVIVSFSPDGKRIATSGESSALRLWNLDDKQISEFKDGQSGGDGVSFSPDGRQIATAGLDGTATLLSIDGKKISEFKGHGGDVLSVSFSPNGRQLATAGSGGTARLWSLDGKQISAFIGHQDAVWSVSFSPDGKQIATAGEDGTARLWSLDGKQITEFKGHQGRVWDVSFSPDGKQLATAGDDGTARLWSLDGKQISEFKGHQGGVRSVSFSPDGRQLATAGGDGMVELNSLDALILAGCNYLQPYFMTHPEALKNLHVCHTPDRLKNAAPALVREGERLAKEGQVERAIALYKTALTGNPDLNFNPKEKAYEESALFLVKEGERLAQAGEIKQALGSFAEAQKRDSNLRISADSWYRLCWSGSFSSHARDMLDACEKAVALSPGDGYVLDGRGRARALTGNRQGAIADFEASITLLKNQEGVEDFIQKRQRWIEALRRGQNPFTEAEMQKLREEEGGTY